MTNTEKPAETKKTAASDMAVPHDHDDATPAEALTPEERSRRSERIVQDHVLLATASGLIPGPALDVAAAFAVQLTMLKRLSSLYGVPFRRDLAKGMVLSFVTSLGGVGAGAIVAVSAFKLVPGLGTFFGAIGASLSLSAFTYAIGKVFQQHFESGGTFMDFSPQAYRGYFKEMFSRGKAKAKEAEAEVATAAPDAGASDASARRATVRA